MNKFQGVSSQYGEFFAPGAYYTEQAHLYAFSAKLWEKHDELPTPVDRTSAKIFISPNMDELRL